MELNNRSDKKYKMTLGTQNVILTTYRRMLREHETSCYLKGSSSYHYNRMRQAIKAGSILCWKCVTSILIDEWVRSKKGKNFTKIWHIGCYHEY